MKVLSKMYKQLDCTEDSSVPHSRQQTFDQTAAEKLGQFKPMSEVLASHIINSLKEEAKIEATSLVQIIEGKDFNFNKINFTGTLPQSKDF